MTERAQFHPGYDVLTRDGQKVGTIKWVGPDYLQVMTGFLGLGHDLFIPYPAVDRVDVATRSVHLAATADEIGSRRWEHRPDEPVAAGSRDMYGTMPTPPPAAVQEGEASIPLVEEELAVRRSREQTGEVVARPDVVEEERTIEVPVMHQEVTIERRFVDRELSAVEIPIGETREVRVPDFEERVEVEKRPRVREEVVVHPQEVTEHQQVTDSARREEAHDETTGDVGEVVHETERPATSAPTPAFRPWSEVMPTYRAAWQQRFGTQGGTWQDAEPAYRFGYEAYNDPRYQHRNWETVEPELRRDWESRYSQSPWERVRQFVASVWNRA